MELVIDDPKLSNYSSFNLEFSNLWSWKCDGNTEQFIIKTMS